MDIYRRVCYNHTYKTVMIVKGGMQMEIQLWREALAPYRLAVDELIVKFNYIMEEYKIAGEYICVCR